MSDVIGLDGKKIKGGVPKECPDIKDKLALFWRMNEEGRLRDIVIVGIFDDYGFGSDYTWNSTPLPTLIGAIELTKDSINRTGRATGAITEEKL